MLVPFSWEKKKGRPRLSIVMLPFGPSSKDSKTNGKTIAFGTIHPDLEGVVTGFPARQGFQVQRGGRTTSERPRPWRSFVCRKGKVRGNQPPDSFCATPGEARPIRGRSQVSNSASYTLCSCGVYRCSVQSMCERDRMYLVMYAVLLFEVAC